MDPIGDDDIAQLFRLKRYEQPCASGGASDFQRRADSSAQTQGFSDAAGSPTPVR
jgi:hypothetical protein